MSHRENGGEHPKKSWWRNLPSWLSRRKPSQPVPGHSQPKEQSKDKKKLSSKPETGQGPGQDEGIPMTVMTPEQEAFHHLIKDRQAGRKGKAEETRQEWLGRIPDMNPRDSTDPDLIRDTLFPLVLDYQIPFVQEYLTPFSDPETDKRDLKNLMALRLVSKSLRDSIDKWIEERLLYLMRGSDSSKPRKHAVLNSVDLNLATDFTKLDGIDITGTLRFPWRSIRVGFNDPEFSELLEMTGREKRILNNRVRILQENITEFLRKLGDQIWHVDFDFYPVDLDMARYFYDVMIQEWLMLMPHLKWMELRTSTNIPFLDDSWLDSDFDSFYATDDLRICEGVLSANPQLKFFTRELFTQRYTHINRYNDSLVLRLPLEAASIGDGEDVVSKNLTSLQQIHSKNWNLIWVELRLGCDQKKKGMHPNPIEIEHVFGFLQQFPTLLNVVLHIDHLKIGEEPQYLRLPNLKYFWIEFGPNVETKGGESAAVFFSLQFLMHCSKLIMLIWDDLMDPNSSKLVQHGLHNVIMMDFKGGRGDLSASNCWDVFPHLGSIDVQFVRGDKDIPWKIVSRVYEERRLVSEKEKDWEPAREATDFESSK